VLTARILPRPLSWHSEVCGTQLYSEQCGANRELPLSKLLSTHLPPPPDAAATLNSAIQTTRNYVEMELQATLLSSALIGIGGSLGLAFGIILLTTRDVVMTVLSMVSIGGVVGGLRTDTLFGLVMFGLRI